MRERLTDPWFATLLRLGAGTLALAGSGLGARLLLTMYRRRV